MSKKLTLAELNKLDKKINKRKKIIVGEEKYEIQIDDFIKDTDIDEIIIELNELLEQLKSKTKVTNTDVKNICSLHPLLVIRKFTDAHVPKENNIERLIEISKLYLNTGLMAEILSYFSQEQLNKMEKRSTELMKETGRLMADLSLQTALNDSKDLTKNA